jgi:hypothetical protein
MKCILYCISIFVLVFGFSSCNRSTKAPATQTENNSVNIRIAFDSPSAPGNTYNELSLQFKNEVESLFRRTNKS